MPRVNPYDVQHATIDVASAGDNTVVADPGTGAKIKVLSYVLVADAAVTVKWKSGSTDRSGAMNLAAGGGVSIASEFPIMSASAALKLTLGGAVGVRGHLSYLIES